MSTDLQVMESREIVITDEQTDLIKRTICKDATDAEMRLFFYDCQRRGTHPLDKLIHFTKRDGKYTPVTSIDFFRLRAHSSGAYAGEGATTYELGEDGLPNECTTAVLRLVQGQVCTWRATARWSEYYPGEKSGFMWRKMPFLMLAKCAEALALRKAFPAELQGLYVKEEMDQAGPEHRPLPKGAEMLAKMEAKEADAGVTPPGRKVATASVIIEPAVEEVMEDIEKAAALSMPTPENPPSIYNFTDKLNHTDSIKEWSDVMNEAQRYDWNAEQSKMLHDHAERAKKRLTTKGKK